MYGHKIKFPSFFLRLKVKGFLRLLLHPCEGFIFPISFVYVFFFLYTNCRLQTRNKLYLHVEKKHEFVGCLSFLIFWLLSLDECGILYVNKLFIKPYHRYSYYKYKSNGNFKLSIHGLIVYIQMS